MSDQEQEPTEGAPPEPEPEPTAELEPGPTAEPEPTPETTAEPTPAPGPRRLTRSSDDRVIAGVCGGLGEYFGVDAVLIRIAALVLVFAGGAGLLLYAIGWLAMPEEPETGVPGPLQAPGAGTSERTGGALALGFLFIALGAFFLVDEIFSDFLDWKYLWPVVLIAVGAAVLVRARR
jgi:phage shock protein PspC (stress-responsive transcriptional regulator)